MLLPSVYNHVCSGRGQVLSDSVAVWLFSWLLSPVRRFSLLWPEPCPSNGVFHFSRIKQGDSLPISLARHQHLLFSQLHLRPGRRVLALFCGNGAIAQQLVQFSDVNVVGIDTDAQLISRARIAAGEAGLADRLMYHHAWDIYEALEQFPDASFDAVFAIELGYRTASLTTLHKHIERLLKPSGRFAMYEWCFTDTIVLTNAEHVEAAQNLLRSFPKTAHIDSIRAITSLIASFRAAGLVNVVATDLALHDKDIPWYRPLECHPNSTLNSPLLLSWWHGQLSIPALLAAGHLQIFSPMVLVAGEKPANYV